MITAEVRVNGALIGHMYIHNEKTLFPSAQEYKKHLCDKCEYYVEYTEVGKGKIFIGRLEHWGNDGAVALMAKAFELIDKKIQKEKK
jgi:hypothetical protein